MVATLESDCVIHKYELAVANYQEIDIPEVALSLTVQMQHNSPYLWALVNSTVPKKKMKIRMYATGQPLDIEAYRLTYINTISIQNGNLIFHFFIED